MRLRQRTADWVTHTFREHNKEADLWAGKGARRRAEEWVDIARITWEEVTGFSGFWDGSFDNGRCGRAIVFMAFSELHGCGLVPRNCSMDAKMGGCGMLVDNLQQWVRPLKAGRCSTNRELRFRIRHSLLQVHFLVACVARGWTVTEPATPVSL